MPKFRKKKEYVGRRQQYRRAKNAFAKSINEQLEYNSFKASDNGSCDNNVFVLENESLQLSLSGDSFIYDETGNQLLLNEYHFRSYSTTDDSNNTINSDNISSSNNDLKIELRQ